jgi:hypothetical protein
MTKLVAIDLQEVGLASSLQVTQHHIAMFIVKRWVTISCSLLLEKKKLRSSITHARYANSTCYYLFTNRLKNLEGSNIYNYSIK